MLIRDLVRNETITLQVSNFNVSPDGTEASFTIPDDKALRASTYRFWVRAFNSMQQPSAWSEPGSFVLTLSALEPQIDTGLEESAEVLASLLPERHQSPVQRPAIVPVDWTVAETAAPQLAVAEHPVVPAPAEAPVEPSVGEQMLIDQAIWMMINPAAPVVSG